uniref:RE01471p (inferred by orthology to a D. melanogaster protein) n=1 Tax=Strongyloides venezuelensis TaxID=75913 RepID=A0A0K0FYR2_STRVS
MNISELKRVGWEIDGELLEKYLEENEIDNKDISNVIKDIDIKLYGKAVLLNILDRQNGLLQGPVVLQLVKFKNVSHTQNYDSYDPKNDFVKMTFTDGFNNVNGINFGLLTKIGSNTPPGTKVLFEEKITFSDGLLLLSDKNIKVLGGNVEKLIYRWKMDKITIRGGGNLQKNDAPKWIPFSKTQQFKSDKKKEYCSVKPLNDSGSNIRNEKSQTINKKKLNSKKNKDGLIHENESSSFKNKNVNNGKIVSFNNKTFEKKEFTNSSFKTTQNNLQSNKEVNNQRDARRNENKSNNFNENNSRNASSYSTRGNNHRRGNFSNNRRGNRNFRGNKDP